MPAGTIYPGDYSAVSPYIQGIAVAPNDGADLTGGTSRGLYIGAAGTLALRMSGDPATTVALAAVTAGQILNIRATRIMATGTTATGIVALY